MGTTKEEMIERIRELPDDATHEELLREIAFSLMVTRGLADADAGRTISNAEMAERIELWRS